MQLAEAESLGAFDYHYRCIRNIYSDFNNRCRDKYVCSSCSKCVHVELFHVVELLSVDDCRLVIREWEFIHYVFGSGFKTLVIKLFCFVDQRIYNEYLPSQGNLVLHEPVQCRTFAFCCVYGLHRLSARRKLIDHRYVKVSV